MKLRTKTLSLIIAMFVASAVVLFGIVSSILLTSYAEIEDQRAARDLQRLQKVFIAELKQLFTTMEDYASWDDTYNFAQEPNQTYVESNLAGDTVSSLGLNFIVLINEAGQVLFSSGYDFEDRTTMPVPNQLLQQLDAGGRLVERDSGDRGKFGLLELDSQILMVAIAPILRSDDTGPARGSIVMGRYLDRGKLEEFRLRTQLDISFKSVGSNTATTTERALVPMLVNQTGENPISLEHAPTKIENINSSMKVGYLLMPNVEGNPLLLWSVKIPRDIYKQGTKSLQYLLIAMAIIGAVLIASVVVLLEQLVLRRLTRLSGEVSQIGQSNDLSSRVLSDGNDELSFLGRSVNWMLEQLQKSEKKLVDEHERAEGLLLNILPAPIAEQLKATHEPIAHYHEEVTVLFADIVGFTSLSARMEPVELVTMLNDIFSKFDDLAEHIGLEKIKTIGDAYMVASGVPELRVDHAEAIAEMALRMREAAEEFSVNLKEPLHVRIGINTGVVVAGVIGKKKFIYDLWGDAVNIASRMESSGEVGMIQVTEATFAKINNSFVLERRGPVDIKGRGKMTTYLLMDRLEECTTGETSTSS